MDRSLPSPEQRNYGQDCYEKGYARGYQQKEFDMRRLRSKREQSLFRRYCEYVDFIQDLLSQNRKK